MYTDSTVQLPTIFSSKRRLLISECIVNLKHSIARSFIMMSYPCQEQGSLYKANFQEIVIIICYFFLFLEGV